MNAFNGEEMAGRKILVREDREDRDVKQYNKENGIERPNTRRPKRGGRGGGGGGGGAPRASRDGNGHSEAHQPSGLQASSLLPVCQLQMRYVTSGPCLSGNCADCGMRRPDSEGEWRR